MIIASFGIGFSKGGFPGVGLVHVLILAYLFQARASTGILLPMLIMGDLCAVTMFGKSANWDHVRKLLIPTTLGVVIGWWSMQWLDESTYKQLIGLIILALTLLQASRLWRPTWFNHLPSKTSFVWTLGILVGITTMLANAAGPVMALYLLAVRLPKLELVGTSAWFFLVLNLFKVPFSYWLNLISIDTLLLNLTFAPMILPGIYAGRWLVHRISQKLFHGVLLIGTAAASVKLIAF